MQCEQNQIVPSPALRELFEGGWQKYRVIYFGAPCGFGKTTAARALMAGHTMCERSAMQPDEAYRRAGLYYELHDDYRRALDCYSGSGDHRKVSELLVKNTQRHPGAAHYYDMERYYFALPREDVLRSPALLCGMSMLTALCLDYEASEQWYKELQNYGARLKKSDAEYGEVKSKLTYLDIALPQRGSRGLAELIGTVFRAVTDKNLKLPAFSVTSCLPSVMDGGKDFCEWSKSDDLLYETMGLPAETVLGRDGVGLADCALCENKFEKGEDVSARVLGLMSRMGEIGRRGTPDIVFAAMGLLARTQTMQGKARTALSSLRADFVETGQTCFPDNLDAMRCRLWLLAAAGRWGRGRPLAAGMCSVLRAALPGTAAVPVHDEGDGSARRRRAGGGAFEHRAAAALLPAVRPHHGRAVSPAADGNLPLPAEGRSMARRVERGAGYRLYISIYHAGGAVRRGNSAAAHSLRMEQESAVFREGALRRPGADRLLSGSSAPACDAAGSLDPGEDAGVLRLLRRNRGNQEIADVLGAQLTTVKSQVRGMMQKLNVSRRSEVKEAALRLHLV